MWRVKFFQDRLENGVVVHARITKPIGPVTTRGKRAPRDIEDAAEAIVNEATTTSAAPERVATVGDFVERVYFPYIQKYKRPSTLKGYRDIWHKHFRPRCAAEWMKDVRTFDVQQWMEGVSRQQCFGRNTLKHMKSFLSGVFKVAKQQGYYFTENPVRDTATNPRALPPTETYAYDLDQIQTMLSVLPERPRAALAIASFAGLRKGEIEGQRWEDNNDGCLQVEQAIWNGHVDDPKSVAGRAAVPIIKQLGQILDEYRLRCGSPQTGPIFKNEKGKPANLNNLLNRELLPALNRCVHCLKCRSKHLKANHEFERDESLPRWHGWHAARRGLATNLADLGVGRDEIQAILRHSNSNVTKQFYIKTRAKKVRMAMDKLEKAMPEFLTVH